LLSASCRTILIEVVVAEICYHKTGWEVKERDPFNNGLGDKVPHIDVLEGRDKAEVEVNRASGRGELGITLLVALVLLNNG
jgi:hypothetical protein